MNLTEFASGLGISIKEKETKQLQSEKRFVVIIEIIHDNKKYVSANKVPVVDLLKARDEAYYRFNNSFIKENDLITVRCLEITYADVPIEEMLTEIKYEMQPISSRWFTPNEIKDLVKLSH